MGWTRNKIIVSGVAAFAVGISLAAPAQADDRADAFAAQLQQQYRITIKPDAADDIAKTACQSPLYGPGLYSAQQAVLVRYPKYSLNLVATVMSAGVLAYCPERLS
ncbi:MAG: hypothetical protein QOF07_2741 [Bradyrhizobium sp.]|nr:hypothetical protein [Bradyrhizobium sp.]